MNMIKKIVFGVILCMLSCMDGMAQFIYGNTGLMHLPTADMQKDKTLLLGWGWLDTAATPNSKAYGWAQDPTMNYYLNITFFPWMEVSYTCTLIKGKYLAPTYGYDSAYFKYWANQDRHFDFRFRLWKEGWWKAWTPQVVVGLNDALHTFEQNGTSGNVGTSDSGNGFWGRQYIAVTKHFAINRIGTFGAHVAYVHNNRRDFYFEGVGVGVNFLLDRVSTGTVLGDRLLHGVNLMAEYDTRTVNVGAGYELPLAYGSKSGKECLSMNLISELNQGKYFSGGVQVKVRLK